MVFLSSTSAPTRQTLWCQVSPRTQSRPAQAAHQLADTFASYAESRKGDFTWVGTQLIAAGAFGSYRKPIPLSYHIHQTVVAQDSDNAYFIHGFNNWLDGGFGPHGPTPLPNNTTMSCFDFVYLCMHEIGVLDRPTLRRVYQSMQDRTRMTNARALYEGLGSDRSTTFDGGEKRGDVVFFWQNNVLAHVAILTQAGKDPQVAGLWTMPQHTVAVAPLTAMSDLSVTYTSFETARDALCTASVFATYGNSAQPLAASAAQIRIIARESAHKSTPRAVAMAYLGCAVTVLIGLMVGLSVNPERDALGFVRPGGTSQGELFRLKRIS